MNVDTTPRLVRDIRDDQGNGPAVLERLLALITVAMLVVLVTATLGQGVLVFVQDLSLRLGGR